MTKIEMRKTLRDSSAVGSSTSLLSAVSMFYVVYVYLSEFFALQSLWRRGWSGWNRAVEK